MLLYYELASPKQWVTESQWIRTNKTLFRKIDSLFFKFLSWVMISTCFLWSSGKMEARHNCELIIIPEAGVVHRSSFDHFGSKTTPECWCQKVSLPHPSISMPSFTGHHLSNSDKEQSLSLPFLIFFTVYKILADHCFLQLHLLIIKLSFKTFREFAWDQTASKWPSHWLQYQCHRSNPTHRQKKLHGPGSKPQGFIDHVGSIRDIGGYLKQWLNTVSPLNFKFFQRGCLF